jgi:DNA-binding HxlR family transcriptional regulator
VGARALSLLGTAPNTLVVRALAEGPNGLVGLQGRGGSPGSTLRARLKELAEAGVIVARQSGGVPRRSVEYELTEAGQELLFVTEVLERWLAESPSASGPFGGDSGKAAISALTEGWSAMLLRALAVKPLSIVDLDSLLKDLNYPSLERRIAAMRVAGQVEALPVSGRETPYGVTAWLRRGVAPLLAAIQWERRWLPNRSPSLSSIDVETIFLLAVPLLGRQMELSGNCRLAVEMPGGEGRLAGVMASLIEGLPPSCSSRLHGEAEAWASGSVASWLRALIDHDLASLEVGGDGGLARGLVGGLHRALFSPGLLAVAGMPAGDEARTLSRAA